MKDPVPTYTYLVEQLVAKYPNLAYLHTIESRPAKTDAEHSDQPEEADSFGRPIKESNDFIRKIWGSRPLLTAGGYSEAIGKKLAFESAEQGVLVVFGRSFIANPDLPVRLEKDLPLNSVDYSTMYSPETAKGYSDYPFVEEIKA